MSSLRHKWARLRFPLRWIPSLELRLNRSKSGRFRRKEHGSIDLSEVWIIGVAAVSAAAASRIRTRSGR
jgi:hypothetical protein